MSGCAAFLLSLAIVECTLSKGAAPSSSLRYSPNDVQILRYDYDNNGLGNYRYGFEQSDGTRHDEQGSLQNEGREDQYLVVKGVYTWIAPNGVKYTITYVADNYGFQPEIEQGPGGVPDYVASLIG